MTDRALLASAVRAWLALYRHELSDTAIRELEGLLIDPTAAPANTFRRWKLAPIEPAGQARVLELIGPKK